MILSDSNPSIDTETNVGISNVPIRRSNKNISYEVQILRSLREVLGEKELVEIRDSILDGSKKY